MILVTRKQGGLGDVIACEVAARAVKEKHPDKEVVWGLNGAYFPLFFDQTHAVDNVVGFDPWDEVLEAERSKYEYHYDLDGPEQRHQLETNYDLTESRIESWVKYVGHYPSDMCPRWKSRPKEREELCSYLYEAGIRPFNYFLIQWGSAEQKKDYPWTKEVVEQLLAMGEKVVIAHHDPSVIPALGAVTAIGLQLRSLGVLCEMAGTLIGPDSSLQHFAAATRTPSLGLFGPTNPTLYLKHYPLAEYEWFTQVESHHACKETFPCFGTIARNHWCRNRPKFAPWCLEQVPPSQVVEHALAIRARRTSEGFFEKKAKFFSEDSSKLFYEYNPNVNINALRKIRNTTSLEKSVRQPEEAKRNPCQI